MRSSYESAAVRRLEGDGSVQGFVFEPRLTLPDGKHILPDFLVTWADGSKTLVEVKPAVFAFGPSAPETTMQRLRVAQSEAERNGWKFEVWTEKELKPWLVPLKGIVRSSETPSPPDDSESVLSLLGVT